MMKSPREFPESSSAGPTGSNQPERAAQRSSFAGRVRRLGKVLVALAVFYIGVGAYHGRFKPLPMNLSLQGGIHRVPIDDIEFLYDLTATKDSQRFTDQMIFDRGLRLIREAQDFVLVDMFLFNGFRGKAPHVHRALCEEVANALLEKKRQRPNIRMVVISDPVNEAYGGPIPAHFKALRAAGIPVVLTDLTKLRDSNPVYSAFWRIAIQWFGASRGGSFAHPFSNEAEKVGLRSWLALFNFKANHRKLIVADTPAGERRQMASLVMSANPHDASSAHSNTGLFVRGDLWRDLLRSEQAVLTMSGSELDLFTLAPSYALKELSAAPEKPSAEVRVLTEGKIRTGMVEALGRAGAGDAVDVAMFYLSERNIIDALVEASNRGAAVRVLLDPNRDAFGYQKNGIPNRPVAAELIKRGKGRIIVRWYDTHGEQFHTKLVLIRLKERAILFTGSANLTRRNIGDLNLETNLAVSGSGRAPAMDAAESYFERLWSNRDLNCSLSYESYADNSRWRYWLYRLQERTGLSTF